MITRLLSTSRALSVVLAFLLTTGPAMASTHPPGADLASIRDWLIKHNPKLQAMQAEAEAADAGIAPAGALPDPMLSIEMQGINPDHPTFLPGNVGETMYQFRQHIPLWGKRQLARELASLEAQSQHFMRDATARELLATAEDAYVRYWHAGEYLKVITRLITLLDQIEAVAASRYALGLAVQHDAIRAQVERTTMRRDQIEWTSVRQQMAAALNAQLGRRADAPLSEPTSAPAVKSPGDNLEHLMQQLGTGQHPALQASATSTRAAQRAVTLEQRNRLPDLTLGVGTLQRGDQVDSYRLMLEVNIPLQQRIRRDREQASRLRETAAIARDVATRQTLESELGTAWSRWSSALQQHQLIEQTLLPQSEATFTAALGSYQVGAVDFGTLLDALREWQGADLARLDAKRDELSAAAAVRAITGDTP